MKTVWGFAYLKIAFQSTNKCSEFTITRTCSPTLVSAFFRQIVLCKLQSLVFFVKSFQFLIRYSIDRFLSSLFFFSYLDRFHVIFCQIKKPQCFRYQCQSADISDNFWLPGMFTFLNDGSTCRTNTQIMISNTLLTYTQQPK